MGWLTIRHPVTGGEATIAESALGQHVSAGWERADEPEQAKAGGKTSGRRGGNSTDETSRRRAGNDDSSTDETGE